MLKTVTTEKIKEYINLCSDKYNYHKNQSSRSLSWYHLLSVLNVVTTASQALTMAVLGSYDYDNITISIVGASFAFLLAILTRIQNSFNFYTVSILNNIVADDYNELVQLLNLLDSESCDDSTFEDLVKRYISINEKSHIEYISHCLTFKKCFI